MKHPYHEETRTPGEIRLSKKAYRKRKMLSKKNRIKSEKLKRKKEQRLQLKEAKYLESSSEAVAGATGTTNEAVNAEIDMSADLDSIAVPGVESGKENVLKDAARNMKEAAEDTKKVKKKSNKRRRSDIEAVAEAKNCTGNREEDTRKDSMSTGTKNTRGRKSDLKRRRPNESGVSPKEFDDVVEDSEGRETPTDQEEGISTENDEARKTAADELPTQPDQGMEARKRKRLARGGGDSSGQNERLKSANDEDAQIGDMKSEKASGTSCANDSRHDTYANNADELSTDKNKANKVDKENHASIVRRRDVEKKAKKEIKIKKKKSKKEG